MASTSSWHEKLLGGFRRTSDLLVGNLALRLQQRIEWDAAAMRATNASAADVLIHKQYRPGFGIGV